MLRSIQVALKEVRSFLQDKGDLAFGLLLPIAIFALMYGAFGGQSTFQGNAYIVNNDAGGKYSNLLIERLNVADNIIIHDLSTSEAESQLQKSDILLATFIPEDFSANLSAGKTAKLVFKQRGNGGQEGQIVAGMIRSAAERISIELETLNSVQNAVSEKQLSGDQIQVTVQKYLDVEHSNPTIEVNENLIGSSPDPVKQFLPGIITMFILFSITLNARAIVEERKKGTLERLMTTRLTSGQLFAGKFLSGIFRGLVQSIILLVLAYAVFQIFTPVTFLEAITIALVFAAPNHQK